MSVQKTSQLYKDLVVVKQHRCSYNGGKVAVSHGMNENWIAALNFGEVSLISVESGEIMFNINAIGQCVNTAYPKHKIISNGEDIDSIITFDICKNDKMIALGTRRKFVRIVNVYSMQMVCQIPLQSKSPICKLEFHSWNEHIIVCGMSNGSVSVYNIDSGFLINRFSPFEHFPIRFLKFNPNNLKSELYLSSNGSPVFKAINLKNGKIISMKGANAHKSCVIDAGFVENGNMMVSVAMNDCICVWNTNSHCKVISIASKYNFCRICVYFESKLLMSDDKGALHCYSFDTNNGIATMKHLKKHQICNDPISDVCIAPNGKDVMITSTDCNFHFGSVNCENDNEFWIENRTLIGFNDEILDIDVLSANRVIIASNSNAIKVMDLQTMSTRLLIGHSDSIMSVCHSGDVIVSASKDCQIRFWNKNTFECLGTAIGHKQTVNCVKCIEKKILISGGRDCEVKVWDFCNFANIECVKTLTVHNSEVMDIAISNNYKFCCSVGMDSKVVLYGFDLEFDVFGSISYLQVLSENVYKKGCNVWSCSFAKNEKTLATAHDNGDIVIWSVPNLKIEAVLSNPNRSSVLAIAFVNSDTQIVSSHRNGVISVWNLRNNECIANHRNHYDSVWKMAAMDDNSEFDLISCGSDSILNFWRDVTSEKEKEKTKEMHKIEICKTKIGNFVKSQKYEFAVKLCLELGQSFKLLSILQGICDKHNRQESILILTSITKALNAELIGVLMSHLIFEWNTNTKYSFLSQTLFFVIFSNFHIDDLVKLELKRRNYQKQKILDCNVPEVSLGERSQNFAMLNSALIAYSKRHQTNIKKLIQDLCVVDFVIC